jgi:hypothetical protein
VDCKHPPRLDVDLCHPEPRQRREASTAMIWRMQRRSRRSCPTISHPWLAWLVMTVSRGILSTHSSLCTSRKGIRAVGPQLGLIPALKISDFNLGDRKNYAMLAPHRYLTKMTGKKPKIVPQSWIKEIARSTILNVMKIPHFGRHQEVNACVKLLLSCYHGGYLWLDRCITVDPTLIHLITGLSMQGPDPQKFYPGKTSDRSLVQCIKEAYGDVEKGKRGYKVASIQDGAVHLACQLIAGKLVRKNHPTQVTGFVVDLAGKCVEGMQMNWVSYLVNELEKDCREAQDQGYEFHFSWLLILIAFVTWEMSEGVTFPEVEPSEPLAVRFTTLWYTSDMVKQWKSNAVFHTYYLQLKCH